MVFVIYKNIKFTFLFVVILIIKCKKNSRGVRYSDLTHDITPFSELQKTSNFLVHPYNAFFILGPYIVIIW